MSRSRSCSLPELLAAAQEAVHEAGVLALGFFRAGLQTAAGISYKAGGSPVTEADLAVDAFLRERLGALAPDFGWLSEETIDARDRLGRRHVWVVDPIDGTRAFARGDVDWMVSVGLVEDGVPIAGLLLAPATGEFYAAQPGGPATLNGEPIRVSDKADVAGSRVAGPGGAVQRLAENAGPIIEAARLHSLAYRLAHVADGRLDAGLAGAHSHDWDIAAADAILRAAGGALLLPDGTPPLYNRETTHHPPLVGGNVRIAQAVVAALGSAPAPAKRPAR